MLRVSEDGNRRREGFLANYRQLHRSLLDLQDAADRVFDTISQRTEKEHQKLTVLSTRIQKAKAKIDSVSHSKQAITVVSSSRYPKFTGGEDFHSLFDYKDGSIGTGFPVTDLLLNGGLSREYGTDGTLELFQFFSETAHEFLPNGSQSKVGNEGFHSKEITSVEHLLQPLSFCDSSFLMADQTAEDSSQTPKHQSLPPPPPSLLAHKSRSVPRSEGLNSRPAVKQIKPLKLPNILSDLPVVSDMSFSGAGGLGAIHKREQDKKNKGVSIQEYSDVQSAFSGSSLDLSNP